MARSAVEVAREYARECWAEEVGLLRELAQIPAPSGREDARATFVRDWFVAAGARDVRVDDAKNVIVGIGADTHDDLAVFAAHTDVVFPDTEPLPLEERDGRMYAPGVGDDTANLTGLMLAARWLIDHEDALDCGVLVVANSCEEGLGNLRGTKAVMAEFGVRVREFVSFDTYAPAVVHSAVGSVRFRLTARSAGGHSWMDYGKRNAIVDLAAVVADLYALPLPAEPRTTMNVGTFEGGTTVNSIAAEATALFEFRSTSEKVLRGLAADLEQVVTRHVEAGANVCAEVIGVRPGNGPVDPAAEAALVARGDTAMRAVTGMEPAHEEASTDANVPLSMGIPAMTIGAVRGEGMHTRGEWVDLASLEDGCALALMLMLDHTSFSPEA